MEEFHRLIDRLDDMGADYHTFVADKTRFVFMKPEIAQQVRVQTRRVQIEESFSEEGSGENEY